jgi:threonine dehydrogenase-like Zn-dependent dehydrogenase
VAILATGFALVPFTLAGKLDDVIVAAGTIGLLALHAATGLAAWVSVTRAARRV